jgi:erythromycin esterase-like protein
MASSLEESLRVKATLIPPLADPTFGSKFSKFSNCKVLLIGDATHGTSEFYTARAKITRHLIKHHGFNIVAIQADWQDAEAIDRYVRQRFGLKSGANPPEKITAFQRFPTWMWRNKETEEFVEWLRSHNKGLAKAKMAGFYGLDIYGVAASIDAVINYWNQKDPKMAADARMKYGQGHGLGALAEIFKSCEANVVKVLRDLLDKRLDYVKRQEDGDEFHSAEQNAKLIAGQYDL